MTATRRTRPLSGTTVAVVPGSSMTTSAASDSASVDDPVGTLVVTPPTGPVLEDSCTTTTTTVTRTVTRLMTTPHGTTTVTQVQDADALAHGPGLLVSTLTTYGWTADALRTQVPAC